MADSPLEIAVGAAVLAGAAAFAVVALTGAGSSLQRDTYPLTASFRSAEGIAVGTEVRLAGVAIGRVTDISLDPQTYRAATTFGVARGVDIPTDSAIQVSQEGLLGGHFVEILPGGALESLAAGDEILDTQSQLSLITLLMRFVGGDDE